MTDEEKAEALVDAMESLEVIIDEDEDDERSARMLMVGYALETVLGGELRPDRDIGKNNEMRDLYDYVIALINGDEVAP
jgi:hypothetical protein